MSAAVLVPWLLAAAALGAAAVLGLAWVRAARTAPAVDVAPITARLEALERASERSDRVLREELSACRNESSSSAKAAREEQGEGVRALRGELLQQLTSAAQAQAASLEKFEKSFGGRLDAATASLDGRFETLRGVVDERLRAIQLDNASRLEAMRATVDEKLQGTLDKRLGESFRLVSERLEQVHAGLGEMQALASGVGDLKRVLTNVSTRGSWGEMRLQSILEQILAPEQFETNVACREGSAERVEFAVKLPGRDGEACVYLPIDAKFPKEDYERLVMAEEAADAAAVESARSALEKAVLLGARTICAKYLVPPRTTDFAIMFLPTEGLYAEVARRPALLERIQRECRVNVAGPTTLAALLTSLQMGFRTLAIEKRSSEVWNVLGQVKGEFVKFGDVLDKVHKKLQEASNTVEQAQQRTRVMDRKLKTVEVLPGEGEQALLPGAVLEALEPENVG